MSHTVNSAVEGNIVQSGLECTQPLCKFKIKLIPDSHIVLNVFLERKSAVQARMKLSDYGRSHRPHSHSQ